MSVPMQEQKKEIEVFSFLVGYIVSIKQI